MKNFYNLSNILLTTLKGYKLEALKPIYIRHTRSENATIPEMDKQERTMSEIYIILPKANFESLNHYWKQKYKPKKTFKTQQDD